MVNALTSMYQPSNRLIFSKGNYYKLERYTKYFAFANGFVGK